MLAASLKGIRVLDLSRLFPGPLCSLMLADLGAEVFKIEPPEGEWARYMPPYQGNTGSTFAQLNRGKKSLTLNLKTEKGLEIFQRLLRGQCDVLLESFRPGAMKRLGLDYEAASAVRPEVVYCSISAYGQAGPRAGEPAHDLNLISMAGILSLSGSPGKGLVIPPIQIADVLAGFQAVSAICAALLQRFREGKGQHLDISMLDGAFFTMISLASMYYAGCLPPAPDLPLSGGLACYGVYRTADGRYLALALLEPKFWHNFLQKIGMQEYLASQMEPGDQSKLRAAISERIAQKTQQEWVELFAGSDICIAPVRELQEAVADPQLAARNMLLRLPSGSVALKTPFVPAPGAVSPCPSLGQHNAEILSALGYSTAEIAEMKSQGII